MCSAQDFCSLLRLRVVAEADPGVIARVLERLQNLNVLPRRVMAEFGINEMMHIEVDVFGLPTAQMKLIAAKIREGVNVTDVHWHPV
jgi:hypothetical protein